MRFIKCENKNFYSLLRFALGLWLLFNCVGAGSCQTRQENYSAQTKQEKYDAQIEQCVLQGQKDVEGGTQCLENLYRSNPDESYITIFLARDYARSGQMDKAEKAINSFISQYPEDSSGYNVRCQIFSDRRNLPAATNDCLTAIRLAPENFDYYRDYATVVAISGNTSAAADLYGYILLKKPGDAPTLVALGRLYEKTNQLDKAIETYEKLLELKDFDLKDKVREGIEKLKQRREQQINKKRETPTGKQGAATIMPSAN